MIVIEVHDELVAWPDEFAQMMIEHYRNRGIPCVVHTDHPLVAATVNGGRSVSGMEPQR